jgi:hypothetical protein
MPGSRLTLAFHADGTGSLEKTFGPIIFRYTFLDALQDGYVKPLIPAFSEDSAEIDVDGLKVVGEDYDLEEQASRAIALSPVHTKAIVETMKRQRRKQVLVFACNIAHADVLEEKLNALGIVAAAVHSHSPKGKREKMVPAFKARELPILISVACSTPFAPLTLTCQHSAAPPSPVFFAQVARTTTPAVAQTARFWILVVTSASGSLMPCRRTGSIPVCDNCTLAGRHGNMAEPVQIAVEFIVAQLSARVAQNGSISITTVPSAPIADYDKPPSKLATPATASMPHGYIRSVLIADTIIRVYRNPEKT